MHVPGDDASGVGIMMAHTLVHTHFDRTPLATPNTPHHHHRYGPGDDAGGADKLGVVAAVTPNGTTVVVVVNTGDTAVQCAISDPRRGVAPLDVPAHAMQTIRYN